VSRKFTKAKIKIVTRETNTNMTYQYQIIFIVLCFTNQLLINGCGTSASASILEDEVAYNSCNNLAQYLVHENQLGDLIDLLTYDRESVITQDENGWTPLHEAAKNGNPLMVSLLVENGVDPLAKTQEGHLALDILRASWQTMRVPNDSNVAKRFEISHSILEKADNGKELNDHIIDREAINKSHEVILHIPALAMALVFYGLKNELEELYTVNPDVINDTDDRGWSPIHEAARNGNLEILRFLILKGADCSKTTNNGMTVLGIARMFARDMGKDTYQEVLDLLKSNMNGSSRIQYSRSLR